MRVVILGILILGSLCLKAQEVDSVLSFKEAIQVALKNNVTLNTQRNILMQSKANKTFRVAQLGPQVSVNGSIYQSNGNRFIQQEAKVVNATVNGAQASLNVSQPIFNGLSGLNSMRASSAFLDAQLEQVNQSTQDVINNISIQFLQVLLDQELLKIAQENLRLQTAQFEQVRAQVELGSRSPVDEYNQQAQLSNAELRVVQAEQVLVNDKTLLFQLLVIDPTKVKHVVEPTWDVNAIAMDSLDLEQLLQVASNSRSDLKQARYTEKASRLSLQANRGSYFPSLNAFYNNGSAYNQVQGADKTAATYRDFNQQFWTDNRSNSFGLSVFIPIYTGFQNRFSLVQSKVLYENSKLQAENTAVIVKADVLRAYQNYESVKLAYAAGLTGLEASQMAYNLEQERYNLGITSFVEFANANQTYVQAQTDMAQAKYRFLFQKIMLDYALGTLKVDNLP